VATAALTLLAVNFTVGETQITERVTHAYTVADPQFQRSMGVLLGPPLVDGNRVDTLVNGREIAGGGSRRGGQLGRLAQPVEELVGVEVDAVPEGLVAEEDLQRHHLDPVLARDAKSLLIGEAVTPEYDAQIRAAESGNLEPEEPVAAGQHS